MAMESCWRHLKADFTAQMALPMPLRYKVRAALDSEKSESETNIVGTANATAATEKRPGGILDVPLPAEKSLKTMGA